MRVVRVRTHNFVNLFRVSDILWNCGKDMAKKYDLHHWDNSRLKSLIIAFWGTLKNYVYLVFDDQNNSVATFQTQKNGNRLRFEKLATSPNFAKKGIGSFCINHIEKLAKDSGCGVICMEVYSNSDHAIRFYEHRGYKRCGSEKTLKYMEIKMEKVI